MIIPKGDIAGDYSARLRVGTELYEGSVATGISFSIPMRLASLFHRWESLRGRAMTASQMEALGTNTNLRKCDRCRMCIHCCRPRKPYKGVVRIASIEALCVLFCGTRGFLPRRRVCTGYVKSWALASATAEHAYICVHLHR